MTIAAITWALNLPLKQPLKGVLVALAYHANKDGRAWPSRTLIAAEAGVTLRTVINATKRLEDLGLIEVEHSSGNAVNRYSVRVGEQCHPATVDSAPRQAVHPRCMAFTVTVNLVPLTVHLVHPNIQER